VIHGCVGTLYWQHSLTHWRGTHILIARTVSSTRSSSNNSLPFPGQVSPASPLLHQSQPRTSQHAHCLTVISVKRRLITDPPTPFTKFLAHKKQQKRFTVTLLHNDGGTMGTLFIYFVFLSRSGWTTVTSSETRVHSCPLWGFRGPSKGQFDWSESSLPMSRAGVQDEV